VTAKVDVNQNAVRMVKRAGVIVGLKLQKASDV
jgi:hypothetical protein